MENNSKILSKNLVLKLLSCAGISLLGVLFIWGFWNKGVYALGLNMFVFLALFFILFLWVFNKKEKFSKADLFWSIPLGLVILSFLIYENPFLKITSLLVFLPLFAVFYNYGFLSNKQNRHWDTKFFRKIIIRAFSFLGKISHSASLYIGLIIPTQNGKKRVLIKSIIGVLLFLFIAATFIVPLLSSADPVFADKMQLIDKWIKELFSTAIVYKIIVFIILSVSTSSMLLAWGEKFNYEESEIDNKKIDPIIPGIVIGGILGLYLLFIWIQIGHLWLGALPFDFKETEGLVKSGFWQLFFLSIINIAIYFFAYRKTNSIVQGILTAFTGASLLLLLSAAYRVGLYVVYYGFSYEKFFASYTVLYCAILFIWLISRLFIAKRSNIVKFLVVLFLWMYALVSIMPVEQFILQANVKLSKMNGSRIKLVELTMLSSDVLSSVKHFKNQGLLFDNNFVAAGDIDMPEAKREDWKMWIEKQEKILADKKWYELNAVNVFFK